MTIFAKDTSTFVETEIEDETVVMLLKSGDFYSFVGTAQAIWQLIDGVRDRDAVVQALSAIYGSSASQISNEVDEFLGELAALGLLELI